MNKAGSSHTTTSFEFSKSLNRISETTYARDVYGSVEDDDIGVAFQKFAIVTRQLSELMKDLVRDYELCIRLFAKIVPDCFSQFISCFYHTYISR